MNRGLIISNFEQLAIWDDFDYNVFMSSTDNDVASLPSVSNNQVQNVAS